jgi:hypothetical protein
MFRTDEGALNGVWDWSVLLGLIPEGCEEAKGGRASTLATAGLGVEDTEEGGGRAAVRGGTSTPRAGAVDTRGTGFLTGEDSSTAAAQVLASGSGAVLIGRIIRFVGASMISPRKFRGPVTGPVSSELSSSEELVGRVGAGALSLEEAVFERPREREDI